jgi:2-dehydro-3-deoxy-D-arabinonate dehydratase
MPAAIFRLSLGDGSTRLAAGTIADGARVLLPPELSVDALLDGSNGSLADAVRLEGEPVPSGAWLLPPVASHEVWAAGVTYRRSRDARVEESIEATPYDHVYAAERPELFCKCAGWRARGPGAAIAVRGDSSWDVPEPELTLVLDANARIVGYTIGNDVSSRSIEGESTLYLPQAKTYDGSCAIGPAIVPSTEVEPPFSVRMRIQRSGEALFDDATSTAEMKRGFEELASYLTRALVFPHGVFLMTGTGLVPNPPFTLEAGDSVRIAIEELGVLENGVERLGL